MCLHEKDFITITGMTWGWEGLQSSQPSHPTIPIKFIHIKIPQAV